MTSDDGRERGDGPEQVVARLRPHARAVVLPIVVLLALTAGTVYGAAVVPEEWMRWGVLGLAAVVLLVAVVAPLARWSSRAYTITDRRVVVRSGVLLRHHQEVLLARTGDITVSRSALQLLAGSGDVRIQGGGEQPVVLHDVPRPRLVLAAVQELVLRQNGRS